MFSSPKDSYTDLLNVNAILRISTDRQHLIQNSEISDMSSKILKKNGKCEIKTCAFY